MLRLEKSRAVTVVPGALGPSVSVLTSAKGCSTLGTSLHFFVAVI